MMSRGWAFHVILLMLWHLIGYSGDPEGAAQVAQAAIRDAIAEAGPGPDQHLNSYNMAVGACAGGHLL